MIKKKQLNAGDIVFLYQDETSNRQIEIGLVQLVKRVMPPVIKHHAYFGKNFQPNPDSMFRLQEEEWKRERGVSLDRGFIQQWWLRPVSKSKSEKYFKQFAPFIYDPDLELLQDMLNEEGRILRKLSKNETKGGFLSPRERKQLQIRLEEIGASLTEKKEKVSMLSKYVLVQDPENSGCFPHIVLAVEFGE